MKIHPYLKLAIDQGASDLYFTPSAPAMLRVEGEMVAIGRTVLTPDYVNDLVQSILTPAQLDHFREHLELDLALSVPGMGRFRVNIFTQRGSAAMVMRCIKSAVPNLADLGVPEVIRSLSMMKRGLVLIVGATGSGKTTTLAAMLGYRNENAAGHILTIEDPIEFLHSNRRSIINQREVGSDTHSYERALHSALREAPDVIQIGEVRRRETMDACLQFANTGHLVLSTLHANNAYQALLRIVNLYPEGQRDQLFMDMSLTLRAIVSQRLVRRRDNRRCVAVEVLTITPYMQELIQSGRISDVREAMAQSSESGMQTFDESLYALFRDGVITMEEALSNADSRPNLEAKINFGG